MLGPIRFFAAWPTVAYRVLSFGSRRRARFRRKAIEHSPSPARVPLRLVAMNGELKGRVPGVPILRTSLP